jgi:hypothetical protein
MTMINYLASLRGLKEDNGPSRSSSAFYLFFIYSFSFIVIGLVVKSFIYNIFLVMH